MRKLRIRFRKPIITKKKFKVIQSLAGPRIHNGGWTLYYELWKKLMLINHFSEFELNLNLFKGSV